MFKLEFDPANKPLALAIGKALTEYGTGITPAAAAVFTSKGGSEHDYIESAKTDAAEQLEEYNEAETVKLNDSAAGRSESQSQTPEEEPTHVQETAQHGADDAPSVDKNGVPFNAQYCAKAAKPFYASGRTAGQWKKGTKVEQADYDTWYAAELANAVPPADTAEPLPAEEFDTANAFGGNTVADTAAAAPVGIGPFIMWTSEQQTAGHLTQADITEAYTVLGLEQKDISPINPDAQTNITSLHGVLSAKVPA